MCPLIALARIQELKNGAVVAQKQISAEYEMHPFLWLVGQHQTYLIRMM